MMLGDGHWVHRASGYYTTTSAPLADDGQEIFQKLGRDAWMARDDEGLSRFRNPETKHQTYVVRERLGDYHWLPKPKRNEYHGTVYCVTVPQRDRRRAPAGRRDLVRLYERGLFAGLTEQSEPGPSPGPD